MKNQGSFLHPHPAAPGAVAASTLDLEFSLLLGSVLGVSKFTPMFEDSI